MIFALMVNNRTQCKNVIETCIEAIAVSQNKGIISSVAVRGECQGKFSEWGDSLAGFWGKEQSNIVYF